MLPVLFCSNSRAALAPWLAQLPHTQLTLNTQPACLRLFLQSPPATFIPASSTNHRHHRHFSHVDAFNSSAE